MTSGQKIVGFVATLAITIVLFTAILSEPYHQNVATQEYITQSINGAIDIYVYNCLECHGPNGEGQDIVAALNSDNVRLKDTDLLYASIERGRSGTDMAAFGINEGGMLTNVQIDSLVLLIQYGDWDTIHARVAQLDMLPTATQIPSSTPSLTTTITPGLTVTQTPLSMQNTSTTTENPNPYFKVVATEMKETAPPVFNIVATDTPQSSTVFDIVPTNTPQRGMPFDIVPTITQAK